MKTNNFSQVKFPKPPAFQVSSWCLRPVLCWAFVWVYLSSSLVAIPILAVKSSTDLPVLYARTNGYRVGSGFRDKDASELPVQGFSHTRPQSSCFGDWLFPAWTHQINSHQRMHHIRDMGNESRLENSVNCSCIATVVLCAP